MTVLDCPHFTAHRCRSCSLLELSSEQAREQQLQVLRETLSGVSGFDSPVWCTAPAGSRIRGRLAVAGSIESPVLGFFNDEHQVVPAADCPLHHSLMTQSLEWLRHFISAAKLEPYSPQTDRGELKFIVLTASPSSGQLMVQWVLRSRESLDRIRGVWRRLSADQRGAVAVMSAGLQPKRSSQIHCEADYPVSDPQSIEITYLEPLISVFVASGSFVQSNFEMAGALYSEAATRLQQLAPRRVLDLYCGSCAFSLLAARTCAEVLGVDISAASIDCARHAATRQGLSRAQFRDCSAGSLQRADFPDDIDVVICNPPRSGLDPATVCLLRELSPAVILYSSCNPATLVRDLQRLSDRYTPAWMKPFEMFPRTRHWEVLCQADLRN
ncbi:MAG UNVERIFIED_CONTAM: methyltransferase domain-containing protein [Planctomycetaceae bacterium]|jgi:23S rRNA (uracil747-C5)-methyltransferase